MERYAEKEGALSLGAKGGMLSVADDLMKNEGKKFLEMMEVCNGIVDLRGYFFIFFV